MFAYAGTLIIGSVVAAWLAVACFAAGHAIMYKRDPRSAAIWGFVSFSLPFVGPWLYWGLGINRVERRAVKRLGRRDRPFDVPHLLDAHGSGDVDYEAVGELVSLRAVSERVTRLPMLHGNTIRPLHNGGRRIRECWMRSPRPSVR